MITASVQEAIRNVLSQEKTIDVLIHAAGIERSRKLENKSDSEFRQIVDIKIHRSFPFVQNTGRK